MQTSSSVPQQAPQQRQSAVIFVNGIPYTVVRLLGEGLHSRVYAAYDPRTSQSVAIKVVQNVDPIDIHEHSKMCFKEIRYLTRLQTRNPYVIRVYNHEYDSQTQTGKIVMETGHDFRFMLPLQALPKEKKMSIVQAKFYWAQMVDAVALLHRNGIVHSGFNRKTFESISILFSIDIKPENFIMTSGGHIRIIDLGLSFRIAPNQVSVLRPFAGKCKSDFDRILFSNVEGTPEYMPPEVCQIQNGHYSRQGPASDVWALGLLILFCFSLIFISSVRCSSFRNGLWLSTIRTYP